MIPKKSPTHVKNTVVINATNIGKNLSGIGIYTLSLLKQFAARPTSLRFIVYLNRNAAAHIREISFPENFSLKWVSGRLSPDYGFKGHLLRLLFANFLSLKHRRFPLFTTSQLEAGFFHPNQAITIHDVIPLLFRDFHKQQYYFFRCLLPLALRRAKYVITPSRHSQQLLHRLYHLPAEKIRMIPNGIQEIYLHSAVSQNSRREEFILYTGRISPMKNIAGLIKAFSRINQSLPHQLVIVGENKAEIEREIRAGRILREEVENGRVMFRGQVSDREMLCLFQRAALLVFPSLYEGFGLPPLEAMACGCPVVASNAASLPEVCGNAAYYVNPQSVESIAAGIRKVIGDSKTRRYLIRKGLLRARRYRWENSARAHLEILERIAVAPEAAAPQPVFQPGRKSETAIPV